MKHLFKNYLSRFTITTVLLIAGAYLILPGASIQINRGLSMLIMHDTMGLTMQLYSLGNQAVLLSLVLNILQLLYAPLPVSIGLEAALATFGPIIGFLIGWLGLLMGAALAYGIAGIIFRPCLNKLLSKNQKKQLDRWLEKYAFILVFAVWLIPVWTVDLIAYLAGMSRMSFRSFMGATALAALPNLYLYASATNLRSAPVANGLYLLTVLSLLYLYKWLKQRKSVGMDK